MRFKPCSALRSLFLCLSLLGIATLSACVPHADTDTRVLLFSADAWGGSPFTEGQKRRTFLDALRSKSVRRLLKTVPFELENQTVTVRRFEAVYEVNAKETPPLITSGYKLILELDDTLPEQIALRNSETDVVWWLRIADAENQGTAN